MDGYNLHNVDALFRDFKARRAAIIRALTADVASFYQQCDPERENLCLYGFPNEQWEVNLPAEEVPPELPEPALGINFARNGMQQKDWLSLVAVHSDSWLLSVAFFFAARVGLDRNDRKRLFTLINDLPTVFEVLNGAANANTNGRVANGSSHSGSKSTVTSHSGNKSKANPKEGRALENSAKYAKVVKPKEEEEYEEEEEEDEEEEEEDEHGDTMCGACGDNYAADEFWICCDLCEKWFHGRCVKITPAKAEHIKQYKCPSCSSNKRVRLS